MALLVRADERTELWRYLSLFMDRMEEVNLSTREAALAACAEIDARIRLFDELGWEETDDRESFLITLPVEQLRGRLEEGRRDSAMDVRREEEAIQKCLAGDRDYCFPGMTLEESAAESRRYRDRDLELARVCDVLLARLDGDPVEAVA